jgi:hypothetical protein
VAASGQADGRRRPGKRTGGGGRASGGRAGKLADCVDRASVLAAASRRATATEARRLPRGQATNGRESIDDEPESIDDDKNWSTMMGIGLRQWESSDGGWASMASTAGKKRITGVGEKLGEKIVLD